jgi:hypothetical protein
MSITSYFNDIEKNVRRNNTTIRWIIILFCVIIISFAWAMVKLNIYYSDKQLILEADGQVRKVQSRISSNEALKIECQHHLAMLYGSLYTLNQFNFKNQIEAAYWLGDESIREAYRKYKNLGWYDQLMKDNIEIESEVSQVQVDLSKYPYPVLIQGFIVFRKGYSTEKFILNGSCYLQKTDRTFPHNPHGLFIVNWQPELKEIKK